MSIGAVWGQFSTKVDKSLSLTAEVVKDNIGKVAKFAVALFSAMEHFYPGSLGLLPVNSGFKEADKVSDLLGIFKATKEISKVKDANCLETAQKVMGLAICILTLGTYLEKMQVVKLTPVIRVVSKIPAGTYLLAVPLSALKMVNLSLGLPDQINEMIEKNNNYSNAQGIDRTNLDDRNVQRSDNNERLAKINLIKASLTLTETVAKIAFIALTLIGTFCAVSILAMTSSYMLVGGLAIATLSLGNVFYIKSCQNEVNTLEAALRAA